MIYTLDEFTAYEDEFNNAKDKSAFFDRYYHPDIEFMHPMKGIFRGKEDLVSFWNAGKNSGHDGIHEILHTKDFLSVEDKVAAALSIEWRCFKETHYFGPRKEGDVFWGRCAAFYDIKDGKFIKVMLYLNLVDPDPDGDAHLSS